MANKMKKTQKEMYNELLALCQTDEQRKFIESRLEQLAKKSTSKKETERQKENYSLSLAIFRYMEPNKKYTVTELMKQVPELIEIEDLSNQRVTYILTALKDNGKILQVKLKGKSYYYKVDEVGEE